MSTKRAVQVAKLFVSPFVLLFFSLLMIDSSTNSVSVGLTLEGYQALNSKWVALAKKSLSYLWAVLSITPTFDKATRVVLTGSRSFLGELGLAYPGSDIEGAVIVKNGTLKHEAVAMCKAVASYFLTMKLVKNYPAVFFTKAGLPLMIGKEVNLGTAEAPEIMFRFEFTVRTEEMQAKCEKAADQALAWTDAKKLDYIIKMEAANNAGDEAAKARQKEWVKVLKEDGTEGFKETADEPSSGQ